jgi:phage I-like protein
LNSITIRKLSTLLDGSEPPKEFRLFHAGENASTKGKTLFDARAAELVMSEYRSHGVDQMIDLEHESLDPGIRPDCRDARGWYELEVRNTAAGPELWAVNVRWTSDGLRRLSEKTQRYISPAFYQDDDGRITCVVNCALTALPATNYAPALVAANRLRDRGERVTAPIVIDARTRARASVLLEKYSKWVPTKSTRR